MQLDNLSPWAADLTPGWGRNRAMQLTCTIKTGFQWDDAGQLTALPAEDCPLIHADEYRNDDPEAGSLVAAADTVPFKSGFEWLLSGSVFPSPGAKQHLLSVSIETNPTLRKAIYVHGPRQWERTLFGWVPGKASQVQAMPITWEQAFGGQATTDKGKTKRYDSNPVGCGYYPAAKRNQSLTMPCFETKPFISSVKDQPVPAGYGPISLTWSPRSEAFQALDADAAAEGRCPYPPSVAKHLFNAAPADQRLPEYPAGASVSLEGFHAQRQCFELPDLSGRIRLLVSQGHNTQRLSPTCDTLLVDTDQKTIALLWRAAIAWHPLSDQPVQCLLEAAEPAVESSQSERVPA